MGCDELVDRAGLDVCTNHSETPAFESVLVAWVAKPVVAYRLDGVPANGKAPLHASPGLWTTVRTRRGGKPSSHDACADQAWPTAPMARISTPS